MSDKQAFFCLHERYRAKSIALSSPALCLQEIFLCRLLSDEREPQKQERKGT